ncbi:hypothetical protein HERIO_1627 [Hepatospora eriocheir]|uniref:Reverse transcriptase domain-containing protein n=1 Tax=Hepatospora eriocheir TaxID=1081669 RepID=A0A1X0Q9P3_9MICR|nr:hypothetical protein HERIO_1627 [Hepatospora eriocheir]
MLFVSKNSKHIFKRIINKILNGLDFVKVYLEEILIHNENIDNYIQHYKIVLERLKTRISK